MVLEQARSQRPRRDRPRLAGACGLRTIAEGVETEAQRVCLAAIGCDAIQGWLIAHAMPATELETWLAGQRMWPSPEHVARPTLPLAWAAS